MAEPRDPTYEELKQQRWNRILKRMREIDEKLEKEFEEARKKKSKKQPNPSDRSPEQQ